VILEELVPGAAAWQVIVAVAAFLVAVHAYRKLSPYFAVTWLGAGLLFGSLWSGVAVRPEVTLLPVVVFYLAAAVTKGLVETRDRVRGNHLVHVIMTGVFGGVIALAVEGAGRSAGWVLPETGASAAGFAPGGVPWRVAAGWAVAATGFYGLYKLLDHVGLQRPAQTVLLFAAVPFLVRGVEAVNGRL